MTEFYRPSLTGLVEAVVPQTYFCRLGALSVLPKNTLGGYGKSLFG
jgi:hypothetical protein